MYGVFTRTDDVSRNGLLASVGDKDIQQYLVYDYAGVGKPMNNDLLEKVELDSKEIISYLDETGWDSDAY